VNEGEISNRNALHLIGRNLILSPVVELGRPRRLVAGDVVRGFKRAVVLQVRGDASRPGRCGLTRSYARAEGSENFAIFAESKKDRKLLRPQGSCSSQRDFPDEGDVVCCDETGQGAE
jgi:hypothetical protein